MAYSKRVWYDRDSEYPNRRTLTNVNDATDVKTYDISRAEGNVTTDGTPLTSANMNDLETRISSAFTEVAENMAEANPVEEPTDVLTKIKIGGVVYAIEAGGGLNTTTVNITSTTYTEVT